MRVLLVEDDRKLGAAIQRGLSEEGYHVDWATDGPEGRLFVRDRSYDVIVLDRLVPGVSGDQLLAGWRREGLDTPVLMLTALDAVADRVTGLRAGADDYLCKPFAFDELLARLETLRRRGQVRPTPVLRAGDLELDPAAHEARGGNGKVELTRREFELLETFLRHPGQVLTRAVLGSAGWDEPWEATDHAIEAQVKNLRKKLAAVTGRVHLRTVRGTGYALEVDG